MSRSTDYKQHSPSHSIHLHTPNPQSQGFKPCNTIPSASIGINFHIDPCCTPSSSPPELMSLASADPEACRKTKGSLKHPSVNQYLATKRNRQIYSLLAILIFFSSLTLIMFYCSECDITTGQCGCELGRSKSFPSVSSIPILASITKPSSGGSGRIPGRAASDAVVAVNVFGGIGLSADQGVVIASNGRRYKTNANKPWGSLYGHSKKIYNDDQLGVDDMSGDTDDSIHQNYEQRIREEQLDDYIAIDYGETKRFDEKVSSIEGGHGKDEGLTTGSEAIKIKDDSVFLSKVESAYQRQAFNDRLAPDTKYMSYLPDGGLSNQFYGMLRAIMLAKSLNRTLVLPSITSWQKDDNVGQNQPWSNYFDLETFKQLTGVKIIELQDVRGPNRILPTAPESLVCHVTCGVGSLRPLDPTAKSFLKQWKLDLSMKTPALETNELEQLKTTLRTLDDEHLLCITNGNNIATSKKTEWDLYGRYLYFAPAFERHFEAVLHRLSEVGAQQSHFQSGRIGIYASGNQESDTKESDYGRLNSAIIPDRRLYRDTDQGKSLRSSSSGGSSISSSNIANKTIFRRGSFISIHARRGEFISYCQQYFQHALQSCSPTTQELASTLRDIVLGNPVLRNLPVYVSTNEDRPEELDEFRALGWHVLDHQAMGTKERLGVFGPLMMDQIFMAQAEILIGVQTSMLSRVGAYRQEDWNGRRAVFL
ncbi:hypothetical protein BX616_008028 [Lobosporangium transversale]|uniref:GDP-fucose protein O-fucosyltransferase 2 n=1 Tax=Lobosporangium transversale TaxID=64571 RepID=A0A1Y2GBP8_9FUNG|nr:GDP-fucose protein O-fucosyltransferase-domain-containing protein [Lobosporangium transversale]KAF9914563.1 hypothetical protein BX616_008028 [Lobosporangium transversale]ORZ05351.1 GDP-fucose protein O-fucosyltransferase-domain-containing protein [Lobosporangium transversale]|eukprot:XP_021877043.1 GDP-fucose protein O-fucosyltransferase-domain-containing protein [Lobosporangium transversale]